MTEHAVPGRTATELRKALVPLALAQFICSFAGSNMNVMITDISEDLDTTVQGVQTVITVFLLVMAALMIPGGKLTDKWGRKRCFTLGLTIYGIGAAMSAVSPGLGVLLVGNSIFEGVGTALLIPPVYILTTMLFTDVTSRAKAFGVITGMGGVGAAAGPLIGGLITTAISWRAAFVFQAVIVAVIVVLSRPLEDPVPPDPDPPVRHRRRGPVGRGPRPRRHGGPRCRRQRLADARPCSPPGPSSWSGSSPTSAARSDAGEEPLLTTALFRNRTSNLGLVTQNVQWLLLLGTAFVVSAYLQVVRGYNAIETGVIFTAATVGILGSSLAAERLAERYRQRTLIIAGFIITIAGVGVLLALVNGSPSVWAFAPGLLLIGVGVGVMLTPSVNVVQSSFPEERQGEISGLSRSVSNLGSCLGTAIGGTILVSGLTSRAYGLAMVTLAAIGLIGLGAAIFLSADPVEQEAR